MKLATCIALACATSIGIAKAESPPLREFHNPVVRGVHPDPSVCRVGDDYYLVTTSGHYFPSIPIHRSRDLVHWELIGHVLTRPSQLDLSDVRPGGGTYAPTLRFYRGTFYVTSTLGRKPSGGGNFVATAKDIRGPWSDPVFLPGADGIDPSLFVDDDGRVYYTGNRIPDGFPSNTGTREIWLQEFDPAAQRLVGERTTLVHEGALHGAYVVEAPHLYKRGRFYYLIVAEGGTWENHAVTVFRSESIRGPFVGNPKNPVLTHRHLGVGHPITCVGHAELVETPRGEWWALVLGVRSFGGDTHHNLGRETFLMPVTWERDWPIFAPGVGRVEFTGRAPDLPEFTVAPPARRDEFDRSELGLGWSFIRVPREPFHSLDNRPGHLRLAMLPVAMTEWGQPSFVGRRQDEWVFTAATEMEFHPRAPNETAGLILLQNPDHQYRLECTRAVDEIVLQLIERRGGEDRRIAAHALRGGKVRLQAGAHGPGHYFFAFAEDDGAWRLLGETDGAALNRTNAGGFTGAYVGLFASSNGAPSDNHADFAWFDYTSEPPRNR